MSSLSHHGIQGQKWGVRRFQNADGTRTAAGKKRYSVEAVDVDSSRKEVKKLVNDFSRKDKEFFFDKSYWDSEYDHDGDEVAKRFVIKEGKNIVAFIDAERGDHHSNESLNIVVGTAQSARGKGYASILSKTMVDWYESEGYKNASMLEWNANKDNVGSRKAAEKAGFKEVLGDEDVGYRYSKNAKKELDELSKARMKTKAIDKEVSDKINSDFKKTRLSKFSPNTTITPYGEAQTDWNSELGFYKSMVVDHYATKWAKKKHADDIAKYTKASSDWSSAYSKFDKKRRKAQHTSIGGTMYIEGNALILGDSSYLEHHGILGQKWGVRRFQNKDGTRTAAGKARDQKKAAKIVKNARLFRASANAFQGTKFGVGANKRALKEEKAYGDMAFEILNNGKHKAEYDDLSRDIDAVASFEYEEYSKKKDAMIEINARISLEMGGIKNPSDEQVAEEWVYWADFDEDWGADLKRNSYDRYLVSKGYNPNEIHKRYKDDYAKLWDLASKDAEEYLGPYGDTKITYKDKYTKEMVKTTAKEELANKIVDEATMWMDDYGAAKRADIVYTDKELSEMRAENAKYSPLKHSALFIEDRTLYLSHHGIRGQRWGVRRFQNKDGSLTNAGRKRLGYATKGAAQTVGKAFKAGVKAGGNAVKAVKAHHEKAEAKKKEKKKEKASKTRLGVMANKDLFTNEELRKLNDRFKLEDEMKMATLQKGVEIAKAVGTIAQNVGTVAKTYEDVTGQSLSPIKRKAAEEKARQDKEDRERRIAREDADEARKAAKEERDIALHEQTLRKAIASADTQEFTAQKTKAEADSSILDLYKKGQDFNGGSDATGQSWVEKAKNGGKNPFDDMIANRDPEYAQIRKEHDEKVARKERMEYLERREKERQVEKEAASKQSAPQQKQGGGGDDALFSQKGSLPIDKDRYRNNRAMEKAKQVKEDAAEERAKKQDEKAVNQTIDDTIEANRSFKETVRAQDPHAYDRGVAKDYIKGKFNNLPNVLADLNPINRAAKKIADKATKEEEAQVRKSMKDQYDQMVKSEGRDEANYVMYQTRVANLQQQGYSERKAKQIADSDPTFSAKRNRKVEYSQKVKDLDATHRKNSKKINKANKELTDYYYKLINGPGYDPGTPKREALDRTYRQKRGELERLEKDNNDMLEKGMKEAKKILEHSLTIQNGVLFIDSSDGLSHHGVKGQRWGVRRFQNEDGSLTDKGRKHYEKAIAKIDRKQTHSDALRGRLERQHPFAVTGSAILGAVAAGMSIAATGGASVAAIAAGSAISAAVNAGITHASYSVSEAWEGRGTKRRQKKRKEYEEMLNHDGMYHVENGTLFIDPSGAHLEHHGVKGMKWGKHLMAGKGEAGAGGGSGEDDEKLKEMAKKAGMSVAEYKQKFASKIGGAASKVGSAVYDAAGGSHKKNAEGWRKMAQEESNAARASEKSSHENSAKAASQDRKYGSGGDVYRRAADSDKENAETHRSNAKGRSERAASEQAAYEKSLAGKYDKMKADRARSKKMKQRQSIERALSNGPVEVKPKKSLGKRLEEKLGVSHEKTNKPKQSKEAKRIEGMFKDAARKDKAFSGTSPKAKKKVRIESASAMGFSTNNPYSIPVDARKWGYNGTNKSRVSVGKRGGNMPKTALNPKHTDTSHRRKSVGEVMNEARKEQTPGDTPIAKPTQYTHANRPRGREKYYKLGQESKGVKKRSRRVKHFDGSDELYTEGTKLVINSKWG